MASENGWNPAKASVAQCQWGTVPGTNSVSLELLKGQPYTIMMAFAADYNAYVEPLRDEDSGGRTETNSVPTSNHLNGTGMDLNWQGPDKKKFRLGITKAQAYPGNKSKELDALLAYYEDIIYCGGYWDIRDWMHFQMGYGTYNSPKTADFIKRKIRPDGFSRYKRGDSAPAPTPIKPPVTANGEELWQSYSIYRSNNDQWMTERQTLANIDAMLHMGLVVDPAALRGEQWAIAEIVKLARGESPGAKKPRDTSQTDGWAINHAKALLEYIKLTNPAALSIFNDNEKKAQK